MGQPKLLLPWGTTTVVDQTLSAWQNSEVDHIVVVAAADQGRLIECIRRSGVDLVLPTVPPAEMRVSVELGLAFVRDVYRPAPHDAWLMAPADAPLLSPQVINQLIRRHAEQKSSHVLVPRHAGRRGHPLLAPWPLAERVALLPPDVGINALLREVPVECIETAEMGVLADLDTPEDYQRWRAL